MSQPKKLNLVLFLKRYGILGQHLRVHRDRNSKWPAQHAHERPIVRPCDAAGALRRFLQRLEDLGVAHHQPEDQQHAAVSVSQFRRGRHCRHRILGRPRRRCAADRQSVAQSGMDASARRLGRRLLLRRESLFRGHHLSVLSTRSVFRTDERRHSFACSPPPHHETRPSTDTPCEHGQNAPTTAITSDMAAAIRANALRTPAARSIRALPLADMQSGKRGSDALPDSLAARC